MKNQSVNREMIPIFTVRFMEMKNGEGDWKFGNLPLSDVKGSLYAVIFWWRFSLKIFLSRSYIKELKIRCTKYDDEISILCELEMVLHNYIICTNLCYKFSRKFMTIAYWFWLFFDQYWKEWSRRKNWLQSFPSRSYRSFGYTTEFTDWFRSA